jgi:hypothetical protein
MASLTYNERTTAALQKLGGRAKYKPQIIIQLL